MQRGSSGRTSSRRCSRAATIVVGIDNFDTFYDPDLKRANLADAMLHPSFELVEADVRDAAAMRRVMDAFHPDAIVHLAARAGVRPSIQDPALYAAVNVLGTTVLLDAARAAKISRLIIASSSSVYGNDATPPFREDEAAITPISPYAATKRAAELMCETYAGLCDWMRIISLRFFTVYGPRQRPDLAIHSFTRKISAGEPIRSSATARPSATTPTSRTRCRECSAPSTVRARRSPDTRSSTSASPL